MQTQYRGLPTGNGIPGDQNNQRLVDPKSGCRVMLSWKSHENVVQGHLVTFILGEKKSGAAKLHVVGSCKYVWERLIWEPYQHKNGRGFCRVDPPM